jgi:hypothetical protein
MQLALMYACLTTYSWRDSELLQMLGRFAVLENGFPTLLGNETYAFAGFATIDRDVNLHLLILKGLQFLNEFSDGLATSDPCGISTHRVFSRRLTFDMSGGPEGAKRPLERPLDGRVSRRLHSRTPLRNRSYVDQLGSGAACTSMRDFGWPSSALFSAAMNSRSDFE